MKKMKKMKKVKKVNAVADSALHVQQRQNGSLKAPKQELKTIYTPLSPPQLESTGNCFPLQKDRDLIEVNLNPTCID